MRKDMNKAHRELLNKKYNDVCEEYLMAFCDNYNKVYEQDSWVAGDAGTIACVGDYFFDFIDVIKYSVDNNLTDWDELIKWYDYTLFANEYNQTIPNFTAWHKGCPRLTNEEQERLIKLKKDFEDTIKEYKNKTNPF